MIRPRHRQPAGPERVAGGHRHADGEPGRRLCRHLPGGSRHRRARPSASSVAPQRFCRLSAEAGRGHVRQDMAARSAPGGGPVQHLGGPYGHLSILEPRPARRAVDGGALHSGQEVVGVLGVSRPSKSPPFRQDELDMAIRLAQLASIALDNARLYSSAQQQLAELQRTQQALQNRLASEGLVARISTSLSTLALRRSIRASSAHCRPSAKSPAWTAAMWFQFSGDGTILDNTHECAPRGSSLTWTRSRASPGSFPLVCGPTGAAAVVSVPSCGRHAAGSGHGARGMRAGRHPVHHPRAPNVPWAARWLSGVRRSAPRKELGGSDHCSAQDRRRDHRQCPGAQASTGHPGRPAPVLGAAGDGGDFSEVLHTLLRLVEDQWRDVGLILLLDEDGKHLHIGASVSSATDYCPNRSRDWRSGRWWGVVARPATARAGDRGGHGHDPRWDGLRDLALRYSLRACWSEPVFSADGQVVGTFAMYYRQPRAPSEAELRTIEMGAHLVGVAIRA